MARSGSRASRRLSRNNRAVNRMLRKGVGKQSKIKVRELSPEQQETRERRAKGKQLRQQRHSDQHKQRISAGLKRYWRNKKRKSLPVEKPRPPIHRGNSALTRRVSKPLGLQVHAHHGIVGYNY